VKAVYAPTWLRYRATSWNPGIGKFLRERIGEFDVAHIFGLYDLLGPAAAKACVERERRTSWSQSGCLCRLCETSG